MWRLSRTVPSSRSRAVDALLSALLALSLAACVPGSGVGGASSEITAILGKPGVNLNPYTNVLSSRQVGALLFRGMFSFDDNGMPVPDLATEVPTVENGGMSADKTQITYHLDPDATWADGKPVTAADVVFTWKLIESGILIDDPRGTKNVRDVRAVDEHTVQLTLIEPDAPFAWRFVPYVLPEHLLKASQDVASADFWFHPVGSRGRLAENSVKGTGVNLVDAGKRRPTIRVVFTENDVAAQRVWDSVDSAVWVNSRLGPTGAERSDSVFGSRWQVFLMNTSPGHPTADLAVRQAFARVTTPSVTPGTKGPFGATFSKSTLDDAAINSALDSAGWTGRLAGLRSRGGKKLQLAVLFNQDESVGATGFPDYMVRVPLQRFGGRIEEYPTFRYTDYFGGSELSLGIRDIILTDFPVGLPFGWAWPFSSSDIPSESKPDGLNVGRIADPQLDAAAQGMREAGDPKQLRGALAQAWSRLEDQYLVWWATQVPETVLYKGVNGVKAQLFEEYALRFADKWTVAGSISGE